MSPLVLVAIGLLAGLAGGMLGIGGGAIMVPLLVLLFDFKVHVAIGTSLAVIVPIAITGALTHYGMANVDINTAGILALGAIVGAVVGAKVAGVLPTPVLEKVFGAVLLILSVRMLVG